MSSHFRPGMAEATRLTRDGRLGEATALIQRLLRRRGAPAAAAAPWVEARPRPASKRRPGRRRPRRAGLRETLRRLAEQAPARLDAEGARGRRRAGPGGRALRDGASAAPAGARDYKLYVPAAAAGPGAMPLVVMLHGCTQTPDDFAARHRR